MGSGKSTQWDLETTGDITSTTRKQRETHAAAQPLSTVCRIPAREWYHPQCTVGGSCYLN